MSKLDELAAKMVDCPCGCHTARTVCEAGGYHGSEWYCPTCKGKGQVALIEGLRKPCSKCHGAGFLNRLRFGGPPQPEDRYDCPRCNSTGWTVVPEAEAFLAMVQWWCSKAFHWLSIDIVYGTNDFIVIVKTSLLDKSGTDVSLANALADAIMQAVEA